MKRMQKFEERGAFGEGPGRFAYAIDPAKLPASTKGFDWRPVTGFDAESALRKEPSLRPILEEALKHGLAIVEREE